MDNKVLRNLSYGVYVLTSKSTKNSGCIINSAMQVTSSPVTILVSVNHDNYTNQVIKESKKFALSILKEESNPLIIGEFGFKSSKDVNKFESIPYKEINDLPVIDDNCGHLVCDVINSYETSTHTLFLGQVVESANYQEASPMTYKYYHDILKGKTPKKATTYQEEKEEVKTKKYKCKVCGYVYEGDSVPDDYICPICGQPHSAFVLIED